MAHPAASASRTCPPSRRVLDWPAVSTPHLHPQFVAVLVRVWGCALLLFSAAAAGLAEPLRIVSLAPNLTELVCVLGLREHLVGRTSACDYPPDVSSVPVVGGFGRPNLEALLEQRPNLVLFSDAEKPGLLRWAENAGARVLRLPCTSWAEIETAARTIGQRAQVESEAEQWIENCSERWRALETETQARPHAPRVYVELWASPLTTVGRQSHLHELVTRAGGRNIAEDLRGAYPHVSAEWVIGQAPEAILLLRMQPDASGPNDLSRRPGWAAIPAVRDGHIIVDIDPDLLLRPGPRLLDGAEQLAEKLAAIHDAASR